MPRVNKLIADTFSLSKHTELLISSFLRLTGKNLIPPENSAQDNYRALFEAPYGVVSHNTESNPVFNYGNRTALNLFEMSWQEFICLPSQKSAEPQTRTEREQLLERVTQYGFIDNYRGIRISSTGRRFLIEDAIVWNLIDDEGVYHGQAAVIYKWFYL